MVSVDPGVYLEKKLLALGNGDALHENASFGGAALVELAVDHSEDFGSSGYPTGCVAFLGEDFVEEIYDVYLAWVGLFRSKADWGPRYLVGGWVGGSVLCFLRMLCLLYFCFVCGQLLFSHGRRIQVVEENTAGRGRALGGHFCENIHIRVLLPWNMVELQIPESAF